MTPERGTTILAVGLKAAEEQIKKRPGRVEYPHDYTRLYGWLEDKVFDLYEAIHLKNYVDARSNAGEIIITVSEIVELMELENEVSNN